MSACNCCEAFPVNVVTFESRTSGAQLSKCGFLKDTGGYWFYKNQISDDPWTFDVGWALTDGECYQNLTFYKTQTIVLQEVDQDSQSMTTTATFNTETCECDFEATYFYPTSEDPGDVDFISRTLNNEYTTAELAANTVGCIPEFSEEWTPGNSVTISRIYEEQLNCNEAWATYAESAGQVRIVHPPTATGYLKVWLLKRVRQYDTETLLFGPLTDSQFNVYEWSGTPASNLDGIDSEANRIESAPIEIDRPDEQTSVEVVVQKWSLIPGYEPSDPIVNEETFELERPSPDCESNGVPTLNEDCPLRE
jgi:hypothetical protein